LQQSSLDLGQDDEAWTPNGCEGCSPSHLGRATTPWESAGFGPDETACTVTVLFASSAVGKMLSPTLEKEAVCNSRVESADGTN